MRPSTQCSKHVKCGFWYRQSQFFRAHTHTHTHTLPPKSLKALSGSASVSALRLARLGEGS